MTAVGALRGVLSPVSDGIGCIWLEAMFTSSGGSEKVGREVERPSGSVTVVCECLISGRASFFGRVCFGGWVRREPVFLLRGGPSVYDALILFKSESVAESPPESTFSRPGVF